MTLTREKGTSKGLVWDPVAEAWVEAVGTVSGSVSVSNMIPAVETGLAKEAGGNLASIDGKVSKCDTDNVAISSLPAVTGSVDIDDTTQYATRMAIDSVDGNISYVGRSAVGSIDGDPVWQIKMIDETVGVIITFADGDADYDNIWDNRELLIYS